MSAVALDTNLMLLLVVGTATGRTIGKRLKNFSDEDFVVLQTCLDGVDKLIATPHVWTEVSNIWNFGIEGHWLSLIHI